MDIIHRLYSQSNSRRDFYNRLEKSGLTLIHKKERVVGFRDAGGRKFSLAKIGISESQLVSLDMKQEREMMRIKDRLHQLEHANKTKQLTKQRGPKR